MKNTYKSKNHSKFLLQFHLIFICKYRKKLLVNQQLVNKIKELSYDICKRHNVEIKYMEVDKDHIHYMIETTSVVHLANMVKTIKSYTTFHIWKYFKEELSKEFWKERTFWTDGYFISFIGNVSERILAEYVKNQG